MNDNLPPNKVKQNAILPFPGSVSFVERVDRLEATVTTLLNMVASLQASLADRESRPEIKTSVEVPSAPQDRVIPDLDKAFNRSALCNELIRVLIDLDPEVRMGATPKPFYGAKKNVSRVYFVQDNSFLYFDEYGRLYAGAKEKKSKGTLARRLLDRLHEMREYLDSPILTAALTKTALNGFVIDPGKSDES